jgi:hypothetical protein
VTYFVTYFGLRFADLQFPHRVLNVVPAHDCVPLENGTGAPSSDLHDDRFGDPGTAEIPRGRSAEVMKDQTAVTGSLESAFLASGCCVVRFSSGIKRPHSDFERH